MTEPVYEDSEEPADVIPPEGVDDAELDLDDDPDWPDLDLDDDGDIDIPRDLEPPDDFDDGSGPIREETSETSEEVTEK